MTADQDIGRRLWRFDGGLRLRHWKMISLGQPLAPAGVPPTLTLPLSQAQGVPARPRVAVGERVVRGQLIADVEPEQLGSALHAPACGTVTDIVQRSDIDPLGAPVDCIEIATEDDTAELTLDPIADWREAPPDALRERIREAGIVGLGGALFPTHVKATPPTPINLLIVNGAECEPYIACDEMLMRQRPQPIIEGSRILARAMGAEQVVIAIEDQMGVVGTVLTEQVGQQDADQPAGPSVQVIKVPTIYPEGGERQLIRVLTGQEVPSGGIPADLGMVCVNVATAAAVADAVMRGRTLTSRIVTVTGRGVATPRNLDVRLGTPLSWLIDQADGYTDAARRLVIGGPMMGIPLATDTVPVTKATNCVLALIDDDIQPTAPELPCIRCMACVTACPARLLPQQLYWHIRAGDFEAVEQHALFDCIECGCCAYVCPSQIPLVDYYRHAKTEIRARAVERARADHARARFEAREQRLEAQRKARERRLEAKRAAVKGDDRKAAIDAAIARARQKKTRGDDDEV